MTGQSGRGPRSSLDRVFAAIERKGLRPSKQAADFKALCPCHDEKTGSLHVTWRAQPEGGRVLLRCFGCQASVEDLVEALDLTVADLFDEPLPQQPLRIGRSPRQRRQGKARGTVGRLPARVAPRPPAAEPVEHDWVEQEVYDYADGDGVLLQQVVRRACSSCQEGKEFAQRFVDQRGKTRNSRPPGFTPVLYRLPEVRAAVAAGRPVWLVEGEKDVHTAEGLQLVATTNPGGGMVFLDAMADELAGAAVQVVLDRDDTGWARGVRVHAQLSARGCAVRLLLPASTSVKADLSDHVQAGRGLEELVEVTVEQVAVWAALAGVGKALRAVRECQDEATERLRLAEAAGKSAAAELERAHAVRWAGAATTRWERLVDEVQAVRRLAEQAGGTWVEQALELASSQLRQGSALARQVHELTGVVLPGQLRPENPVEPVADKPALASPSSTGAGEGEAAGRRVRKLRPGQVRYEAVDGALFEMRPVCKSSKDPHTGEEFEVWQDKPKLILDLAPELVEYLQVQSEEAEDTSTRGRDSGPQAGPKRRFLERPSHVTMRYVHPVTGQTELVVVEYDKAEDGSWLGSLALPGLVYDSSRSGRTRVWDAIRQTSMEVVTAVLHRATGWHELPEHGWGWVHARGAITAKGNVDVPVRLTGTLSRFDLPDPVVDAERVRQAFLADSMGLLDRFSDRLGVVLVGHMFRAAVAPSPFSPVLCGPPGSLKTGMAALAMHHFGEAWDRDKPGTSMSGNGATPNAMRWTMHFGKDTVMLCDDVAPDRDWTKAQSLLGTTGRMVHNKEGRPRLSRDGQEAHPPTAPRSSALFTSEVYPNSGSDGERLLVVPLVKGELDVAEVVALDQPESRYGRAMLMSSYLSWLAADLPVQRELMAGYALEYRTLLLARGGNLRKADGYGQLWAGWKMLTSFLVDTEALSSEERDALLERVYRALDTAMAASVDPDVPATTGGRVREMLAWAFKAGLGHVLDVSTGECPEWPLGALLGHRAVKPLTGGSSRADWHGAGAGAVPERTEVRGDFAGYVTAPRADGSGRGRELLLDRLALEKLIKTVAGQLSDAPVMDGRTAARALHEAGVLKAEIVDGHPPRYTLQRVIGCLSSDNEPMRQRMVVLDMDMLFGNDPDDPYGLTEPDPPAAPSDADNPGAPSDQPGAPTVPVTPAADPTEPAGASTAPAGLEVAAPGQAHRPLAERVYNRCDGAVCTPQSVAGLAEACWGCGAPTGLLFDAEPFHPDCWLHSDPTAPPANEDPWAGGPEPDGLVETDAALPEPPATQLPTTAAPAPATPATAKEADEQPAAQPRPDAGRHQELPAVPSRPAVPAGAQRPVGSSAVAVCDADRVVLGDGSVLPLPEPLQHLGHLAELADRLQLGSRVSDRHIEPGTIVVTDALAARLGLPIEQLPANRALRAEPWTTLTAEHPVLLEALQDGWQTGPTAAGALRGWIRLRHPSRPPVQIAFAGLLQGSLVADEPTAEQLARRLQLIARHLRYPWRINASATGFSLLRGLRWKDRETLFSPVQPVPPALLPLEPDLNWSRVPYRDEQARRYLHVYDRGGSYLAAMAGLEVGHGNPTHHPDGLDVTGKPVPGYYRVRLPAGGDLRMPSPLYTGAYADRRHDGLAWVSAPTIELALTWDMPVEVVEAYLWPKGSYSKVFVSFYERLRDARTGLDLTGDIDALVARQAVKDIYTQTIGMMGSHQHQAGKPGYAPDRRHAIMAKARCNLLRKVQQIGLDSDRWPVAIGTDSIGYVSDQPDPIQAWPGKPGDLGRGLGKYKPERSGLLAQHLPFLTGAGWSGKAELTDAADWPAAGPDS